MEGSHQKGSNWYRCLFVYRRSITAADVAGHPRVIGIREDVIVEELFNFLSERIFANGYGSCATNSPAPSPARGTNTNWNSTS
jgi:hypothetical protein